MTQAHSARLRHAREKRGWSRNYVAEQVGVDIATVGRWERGERFPHPRYRQKLCALFELSAQDLGLFSEQPENLSDVTASHLPTSSMYGPDRPAPSLLFRDRRRLLIGLGGLGTAALLTGGAWVFHSSISASHASSVSAMPRQPFFRTLHPNTSHWVNNLAWSPDGSMLAAANNVPLVTTWNIERGTLLASYPTLNQWVNDVSWSNSNQIAAAITDGLHSTGAVQIWVLAGAGHFPLTLPRTYPLRTVSWSPNGEYLAFAGHNTMVEIWGSLRGNPTSRYLEAGQGAIAMSRVKWSSDATYLAAAADDGAVYVWESATAKLRGIYRGHQARVVDIAWCPHSYCIASASIDKTVQVWDALSYRTLVTYRGHTGEVHGIDWSPDGKSIISAGYDATAQVWDALTGKSIVRYNGFNSHLLCALWSIDGRTIALGSKQQGICILQAPFP